MAGKIVEQGLSECAIAARELGIKNFIIAGGETSGAVSYTHLTLPTILLV